MIMEDGEGKSVCYELDCVGTPLAIISGDYCSQHIATRLPQYRILFFYRPRLVSKAR